MAGAEPVLLAQRTLARSWFTLRHVLLLLALGALHSATAAPVDLSPPGAFLPSRLPFTYVLDYNDAAYFADDYAAKYDVGPPYLLHMGTVTPCHSYFGPAHEANAALGKAPFPPIETFVAQYHERLAKAQERNRQLHERGVKLVIAYVCLMTTGGDPDKRTGFWHFYDNWEAFTPLGAGPKPAADPLNWQQRRPDGSEQHFYAKTHYRPLFDRYANCVNNPHWQQYLAWVIRGAAEAGFDGVFVDNAGSQRCYCSYCREGFARYLRGRYGEQELQDLFGGTVELSADLKGLRGAETRAFWAESIHSFLEMIRKEGSGARGRFYVFPNGTHGNPDCLETMFRDCDLAMDENSVGTYGTNPGRVRGHVVAGLYASHVNDNVFSFQCGAACGAPVRQGLLTLPGYPRAEKAFVMNTNAGALGCAEAAAFSGGGCLLHNPPASRPDLGPVRAQYNAFFTGHRDWYEGLVPAGTVGVLAMLQQHLRGDAKHLAAAQAVLETLQEQHVPADPVPERRLQTDLSLYRALIVPPVGNLSAAWARKLADYRAGGGTVIIDKGEATAAADELDRPRAAQARQALLALGPALPAEVSELLLPGRPLAGLAILPPDSAEFVRTACYADSFTRPRKLVLHLVNYDVTLGEGAGRVGSLRDLPVSLPLPVPAQRGTVVLARPGQPDCKLPAAIRDRRLQFTVPALDLYALCLIRLEPTR